MGTGAPRQLEMTELVNRGEEAAWSRGSYVGRRAEVPCVPVLSGAQQPRKWHKAEALAAWPRLCLLPFYIQLVRLTRTIKLMQLVVFEMSQERAGGGKGRLTLPS